MNRPQDRPRTAKEKLAAGLPVAAVNVGGANIDLVETLGRLGADLAFVDCERTGIGLDVAAHMIRAAHTGGMPAVVRSWSKEAAVLVTYLDRRADGIVVPRVESAEEAKAVVEVVRYACGDEAGDRLVIVQIETREAVKNVDELAQVEGVDVFLIGPNDLAYDMGFGRGARTREVADAIDHVAARLRAADRRFGLPVRLEEVDTWLDKGATFLYYPVEWLLARALTELKQALAKR